jgi:hypothetical protein
MVTTKKQKGIVASEDGTKVRYTGDCCFPFCFLAGPPRFLTVVEEEQAQVQKNFKRGDEVEFDHDGSIACKITKLSEDTR